MRSVVRKLFCLLLGSLAVTLLLAAELLLLVLPFRRPRVAYP